MTRARDISNVITDANLGGTLDVSGAFTSQGIDDNADATAITIDSSENVLVNTTDTSPWNNTSATGILMSSGGVIASAVSGDASLYANRLGSDGGIIQLRKGGTTVGNIGTLSGDLYLGTGTNGFRFLDSDNAIIPVSSADGSTNTNTIDLGASFGTFKDLYLSGGLFVGGTGSANQLDDYEEGTWTPVLGAASSDPTVSYTANRSGSYIKVGDVVHVMGRVNTDSVSGGSGNILIRGLPFATSAERNAGALGYISQVSNSSGYTQFGLNPDASASTIRIVQSGSGLGGATVAIGVVGNGFDLTFSHTYKV